MRETSFIFFIFIFGFVASSFAQTGIIKGVVIDEISGEPLRYSNIELDENVVSTDELGEFKLELEPGYYKIKVSYLSYEPTILHQVKCDPVKPNIIEVKLKRVQNLIDEVVITGGITNITTETPLSVKTIGINEINRFPGTTLDVSKIIKNLPGVLPKVSFGYNIIVRGGASHENKFFIDGIEIPSINHFSVQGISGGPTGIINVDLLSGADLITGAFPANRYNALSSVLNLRTRKGRDDRIGGKFTLGATDVGLTLEGPINKNTTYIASLRKSFSEYYLKAFKLPILPEYSDYNFKVESKFGKNQIKIIGIGGFDKSRLNLDAANEPNASQGLLYNTGYIPEGDQSVHTIGLNYRRFTNYGFRDLIGSTSYFKNLAIKYYGNTFQEEDLWYNYDARELNSKVRYEESIFTGDHTIKFGFSGESMNFSLDNYSIDVGPNNLPVLSDFTSELSLLNYGLYASYKYNTFDKKLSFFTGLRMDGSSYGPKTTNLLNQFSPRLAISYKISDRSSLSTSLGSYYMLPPSVLLAFTEQNEFVNKDRLTYINSIQSAVSYQIQFNEDRFFSAEAYYKIYDNYPFLLRDSVSFANANADYVVVGNQMAESSSKGRTYGLELFAQQKFRKNNLWSASYTYSVSEFEDKNEELVKSSWDIRHFMSFIYARTFGNNWQIGGKFTYASATPYTPFDVNRSSQIDFWDLNRRGAFDYENLNSANLNPFHQLDVRLDKNYYFTKWTLNLYIDIQNIYSSPIEFIPYLVPQQNENGEFIVDPNNSSQYLTELVSSDSGRVLPTIGIIAEF